MANKIKTKTPKKSSKSSKSKWNGTFFKKSIRDIIGKNYVQSEAIKYADDKAKDLIRSITNTAKIANDSLGNRALKTFSGDMAKNAISASDIPFLSENIRARQKAPKLTYARVRKEIAKNGWKLVSKDAVAVVQNAICDYIGNLSDCAEKILIVSNKKTISRKAMSTASEIGSMA